MIRKRMSYNEMDKQVRLIFKDTNLSLMDIDISIATLLKFYGWDAREYLTLFCKINKKDMEDYRIRAIEYHTLSDKDKEGADTYRRISRLPLAEIDGKCRKWLEEFIELSAFEPEIQEIAISYKRFLNDEDFVLAIVEGDDTTKHWKDVDRHITHNLYQKGWWVDEVCKKVKDPQTYPNLYWYVKLAKYKDILPTYNFEDKKWEWSEENKQKWENR
jgi:hypothetical protein